MYLSLSLSLSLYPSLSLYIYIYTIYIHTYDRVLVAAHLRQAEVAELRGPGRRVEHVGALQVQVEDPLEVQVLDPAGDVHGEGECLAQRQLVGQRRAAVAVEELGEAPAAHVLGDEQEAPVIHIGAIH